MTRKDILQTLSKFQQARRDEFGIVRLGVFGSTARDPTK
jgi:predicted nucleotidyltransferase